MKWVIPCRICGRPFEAYSHLVGDQSVCSRCRAEAAKAGPRAGMRVKTVLRERMGARWESST